MKQAAFFDLDKTLISKVSSVAFVNHFRRHKILTRRQLLQLAWLNMRFMWRSGPEESMKLARLGLELCKGFEQKQVREMVETNVAHVVNPILFSRTCQLMREHAERNHVIVIVSSSPDDVVFPIGQHLAVDFVIASRPEIEAGRYTGTLEFFSYGENKVRAMQELATSQGISLADSYAYTDSITDLPLLTAVGSPTVVNPDPQLKEIANSKGWKVEACKEKGVEPSWNSDSTQLFSVTSDLPE